jgi:hypothetical protein
MTKVEAHIYYFNPHLKILMLYMKTLKIIKIFSNFI